MPDVSTSSPQPGPASVRAPIKVVVGRSALIVSFSWRGSELSPEAVAERLLQRKLPSRRRVDQAEALWIPRTFSADLTAQLFELDPLVRRVMGAGPPGPGAAARLELSEQAKNQLFGQLSLVVNLVGDDRWAARPRLKALEVVLFPGGAGLCVVDMDWSTPDLHIDGFLKVLEAARHLDPSTATHGWQLRDRPNPNPEQAAKAAGAEAFRRFMGPKVSGALETAQPISFRDILTPLLHLGDGEGGHELHVAESRYARHHSAVVLAEPPLREERAPLAFGLSRAYGPRYAPPTQEDLPAPWMARRSRLIEVAREGSVSLSWNEGGRTEWVGWPDRFMSMYLQLALYVLGQRLVLGHLMEEGPRRVESLRTALWGGGLSGHHSDADEQRLVHLTRQRDELRQWAGRIVEHNLLTVQDESGGLSDYALFMKATLSRFGLVELRSELREEIREVLPMVDSAYREVQEYWLRASQERSQRFNDNVGMVVAATVPASLMAGVLAIGEPPLSVLFPNALFWAWVASFLACVGASLLAVAVVWLLRRNP